MLTLQYSSSGAPHQTQARLPQSGNIPETETQTKSECYFLLLLLLSGYTYGLFPFNRPVQSIGPNVHGSVSGSLCLSPLSD